MIVKKSLKKADINCFSNIPVIPLSQKELKLMKGREGVFHKPAMVGDFLSIEIYKLDGKKPAYIGRAFAEAAEGRYGFQRNDLTWTTANVDSVAYFWGMRDIIWLSRKDEKLEMSFFGGKDIQAWLDELALNNLKKKHEKDIERRNADMALVRPLTKDQEDFLERRVFKGNNFAIFDRKSGVAKCTACGRFIPIEGLKHLKERKCPECGEVLTARSNTCGIANQFYNAEMVQVAKTGEVIFRYFQTHRYFNGDMTWDSGYSEVGRSVYPAGTARVSDSRSYVRTSEWYGEKGKIWKPVRELRVGYMNSTIHLYGESRIYRKNVSALKKSAFKYAIHKNLNGLWDMVEKSGQFSMFYFENILTAAADARKPEFEYFLKIGWLNAFWGQLNSYSHWYDIKVDREKKSIYEMLGLTKEQYASLGKNPSFEAIRKVQKANEAWQDLLRKEGDGIIERAAKARLEGSEANFTPITGNELSQLEGLRVSMEDYTLLRCFMSHHKVVKYLSKANADASIWKDYIEMELKLGYKKDEIEFFPKDLRKAHDDAVKLFDVSKNDIYNKNLKLIAQSLKERYAFDKKGYTVVIPESVDDFAKEAAHMNNCVASHYLEPCAEGSKIVLFLRKKDEIEKSLVDIEVKNGEIRQLYAANNIEPSEEVKKLIYEDFAKEKGLCKAA